VGVVAKTKTAQENCQECGGEKIVVLMLTCVMLAVFLKANINHAGLLEWV
jgi:hypothetical protein